ncbi:hypothetical protein DAE87_004589 [Salmonella enterica subsp. enterica serovar Braenderup]|nr:hypothetical protein [Salmonella enterica subsp. enterica serovar Braenderup]
MAFWDNQDLNFGGDSYNPTQSNVLGQSLAPITPNGDLAASDPQFDQRNPLQIKQDAQIANQARNSPDEDENTFISDNNNRYKKVSNTKWDQSLAAAANYMSAYFSSNGNVGQAAKAAGQALADMDAKATRFSQINEREAAGESAIDIQSWIDSGNKADLTRNKGSWTSGGNGTMFNTLTGETRQIPGAVNQNIPVKTENLGDRVVEYYADGTTKERTRGVSPETTFKAAGATGGSIGLDDEENAGTFQDPETGLWMQRTTYANGREKIVPLGATAQKTLNEKANAGNPTANQQLITSDLQTVNNATPEQINTFTGQIVGRTGLGRDVASSLDPETRKVYQASERLGGQLGNAAIAGAKAAGASGINTEAEIKRFTAAVPQVDYTSEANYKASIAKIQQYAENFKNELIRSKGGKPAATQSQQLTDDELLQKYGG